MQFIYSPLLALKHHNAQSTKTLPAKTLDFDAFCDWLERPALRDCDPRDAKSVKAAKDSVDGWLPCTLHTPKRANENVEAMQALVLDFDDATEADQTGVEARLDALKVAYGWHESFTCGLPGKGYRFRFVIPLNLEIEPGDWGDFWDHAVGYLLDGVRLSGDKVLDYASRTPAQFFYSPSCPLWRAETYGWGAVDGAELDIDVAWLHPRPYKGGGTPTKVRKAPTKPSAYFQPGTVHESAKTLAIKGVLQGKPRAQIVAETVALAAAQGVEDLDEVERTASDLSGGAYVTLPLTDAGLAARVAQETEGTLRRYKERWYRRADTRSPWDVIGDEAAQGPVAAIAQDVLTRELEHEQDEAQQKAIKKARLSLQSYARATTLRKQLATTASVIVDKPAEVKRHELRTPTQIVDLKTGETRPTEALDFFLRSSAVDYDPRALTTPLANKMRKVLLEIANDDAEKLEALQIALGYCTTGEIKEQRVFYLRGSGRNGKSLLLNCARAALGSYALPLNRGMVQVNRTGGDRHDTELAQLEGARLAYAAEIDEQRALNTGTLKTLSGDDDTRARLMGKDFFTFENTTKIAIAANIDPPIKDTSDGNWRRFFVIPFVASFEGRDDTTLLEQSKTPEGRAFWLAWLIEGAQKYYAFGGLFETQEFLDARETWRQEEDYVRLFLNERCVRNPDARTRTSDLYAGFRTWCTLSHGLEHVVTRTIFGRRLQAIRNITRKKIRGDYFFFGVRLGQADDVDLQTN